MTLRRLERLLSEARLSSNTQDADTVTDNLLVLYANRVQSMIEDQVFLSNSSNNIFMDDFPITMVYGQTEYDLPFDIYARNAIKSVAILLNGDLRNSKDPIPFISESQDGNKWGYSLKESKIVLALQRNVTDPISVNYVRKIPTLGKRFGAAITAAGVGTLTVGATTGDILVDIDDYFSTVDGNGAIVSRGNKILTYTKATGVLTFTAGTGTVTNGHYVIPGTYATSHSQLPLECEKIFLEILERRIAQRQSAADMNMITQLTEAEVALVDAVFAKGTDDNEVPPILDFSEFC